MMEINIETTLRWSLPCSFKIFIKCLFPINSTSLFSITDSPTERVSLLRKKADWARDTNEPKAAAQVYLAAGDTMRAIEIMANHGWVDM